LENLYVTGEYRDRDLSAQRHALGGEAAPAPRTHRLTLEEKALGQHRGRLMATAAERVAAIKLLASEGARRIAAIPIVAGNANMPPLSAFCIRVVAWAALNPDMWT
jgi:hypothetical protein